MSQQPLPKHEYQSEGCTAHPGGLFCGRDASDAIHAQPGIEGLIQEVVSDAVALSRAVPGDEMRLANLRLSATRKRISAALAAAGTESAFPRYPVHEGWCSGQHLVDLEGNGECISREALARWNTESAAPPAIPLDIIRELEMARDGNRHTTSILFSKKDARIVLDALAGTSVPAAPAMTPKRPDELDAIAVIARSWSDGYRAAKDPDKTHVIPDFLVEAEDDFGARAGAYAVESMKHYGTVGFGWGSAPETSADAEIPRPAPAPAVEGQGE